MQVSLIKRSISLLPRPMKRATVVVIDALLCTFSVWISFGVTLNQWGLLGGVQWLSLIIALSISLPLFLFYGLYKEIFRYIGSLAFSSLINAFVVFSILYFVIFFIVGVDGIPRAIGIIEPVLLFLGVGSSRYFIRNLLSEDGHSRKIFNKNKRNALIYGAGSAGRSLALTLASSNSEIFVKGFVDDNLTLHGHTINGLPIYNASNIQSLIHYHEISDILLAIPSVSRHRRAQIISSLSELMVRVRTLPNMANIASGQVQPSGLCDLDVNDLLGRDVVSPNTALLEKNIRSKVVLITGAGGSIGSELCRQVIKFSPKSLILIDISEYSLYLINEELERLIGNDTSLKVDTREEDSSSVNSDSTIELFPYLGSVRDYDLVLKIFAKHKPDTVFHAAAYKHVPLVESNPSEGILNNVMGTLNCAKASLETGVSNFTLISTDKAVRPTNIMGASKRVAELVLQSIANNQENDGFQTCFSMVRFGNVLGSSGSVTPLFSSQIRSGGPITLTHPDVTRYFMTIPEAAQLVIQSSALAAGGDVFVLHMGDPVRIYDLAVKMIYLSGLIVRDEKCPAGDIEIKITGLRKGEKLYEELLIGNNPQPTRHPKIMKADEEFIIWPVLWEEISTLRNFLEKDDFDAANAVLKKIVSGYQPSRN